MYQIFKKEPVEVKVTEALVYFRRKKVAEDQSFRAVVVPSYTLPIAYVASEDGNGQGTVSAECFQQAIAEVFMDTAGTILREYLETNTTATEIPEESLSFSAVVSKMAEMQTSQRLNSDQIKNWYDASATKKAATERYGSDEKGTKKTAVLREKYASLASNNPGIDAGLATKMLAYIENDDAGNTVAKAVAKRLERLTKEKVDADEL